MPDHANPGKSRTRYQPLFRYATAAGLVGLTLWLLHATGGIANNRSSLILFFLPILLSAHFAGLGAGLLAIGLSVLSAACLLFPLRHGIRVTRPLDWFHHLRARG